MKVTEIHYRRLVSFRDCSGPSNESFGLTVQVDDYEDWQECKEILIEEVELELNKRGTLRESTAALQCKKESLEHRILYLEDLARENEALKALIHHFEITETDDDIPF